MLLHPRIYPRVSRVVSITASDYSDEPQTLELGLKVGHIQEVAEWGVDPAMNALNRKSLKDLTEA